MTYRGLIPVKCTAHLVSGYIVVAILSFEQRTQNDIQEGTNTHEQIYRAHAEYASQWQGMCLCGETSIDMKFCNTNGVLYDRWNQSLITYII